MIYALDWETLGLNCQKPITGCLLGNDKTRREDAMFFSNPIKMLNKIKELSVKGRNMYVYAHNMSYDFSVLFNKILLEEIGERRLKVLIPNKPFWAIWHGNIHFLDTMAFYSMSLNEAAKIIGQKKIELPIKLDNKLKSGSAEEFDMIEMNTLRDYCYKDTKIVYDLIIKLKDTLKELGFEPRKLATAGQVAMTCYMTWLKNEGKRGWIAKSGEIHKNTYPDEIRVAYKGPYDVCFQNGKFEKVTELDINKHYSHILSTMEIPDILKECKILNPLNKMSEKDLLKQIGVMKCEMKAPKEIEHPFLPIRVKKEGRSHKLLVMPRNARMKSIWTIIEIQKAVTLGYKIQSCDWAITYKPLKIGNIFCEYFKRLYSLYMKEENKGMRSTLKLLMNSLGGKFGQKPERYTYEVIRRENIKEWEKKGFKWHCTNGEYYVMKSIKPVRYIGSYVNYIIGALMTANARIEHYEGWSQIPRKDLIELNTDNVKFQGDYTYKFNLGNEMGQWKVQYKDEPGYFNGENCYWIADDIKISGVPKRQMTKSIVENQETVEVQNMIGVKDALNKGDLREYGKFRIKPRKIEQHSKMDIEYEEYIEDL